MWVRTEPPRFVLFAILVGALSAPTTTPATAQVGVVADSYSSSVLVFDGTSHSILGRVYLPSVGGVVGDCAVTADGTRAFVTDFGSMLWVIDLTTSPPSLAGGQNPIPISNFGEDVAITPDQKFVVASDGSANQPISVVDIASQAEIHFAFLPYDCNSVDVCGDGSVLATSSVTGYVYRFTIDSFGNLTYTGESLFTGGEPNNVFSPPGGGSGIVITRSQGVLQSFHVPGLLPVSTRSLSSFGFGVSGVVNPAGDRVYARSDPGTVDVFSFDSTTAQLGLAPLFTIPVAFANTYFGMDQMAIHPSGARLYVSRPGGLDVYDAATGSYLTAITDSLLQQPAGVAFATAPFVANHPPHCDSASAVVTMEWPPNHELVPVTIVGVTDADSDTVTINVIGVTQDEPLDDLGDGNTCADGAIVNGVASVRSERSGRGNGRVYGITFLADDGHGGTCQGTVTVCVPHDQNGGACVNDGQIVNSMGSCDSAGVKLLAPHLAEVVGPAQLYTVRYQQPPGPHVDRVALLYSFDQGTNWTLSVRGLPNTGEIVWPVPPITAENVLVAVADVSVSESGAYQVLRVLGESDYFSIATPLAVVEAPTALTFAPIQPSPTAGNAHMRFALPRAAEVTIEVLDVGGRRVKTLLRGVHGPGWHDVSWAGDTDAGGEVGPGLYLIRLRAGQEALTRRLVRRR